jgi:hypothetical protein
MQRFVSLKLVEVLRKFEEVGGSMRGLMKEFDES